MLRIAQIVANIVKSICTPSWRLSTRFHEKDELVGWLALLLLLVFGRRSDRNFPLAGPLGNSAKGASFWPLILAGTAPRDDDGLGMMIHFAAPLFLDFTSHAVAISSCFTHTLAFPKLFFFAFPQNSRAFPLFSSPAAWTLIFFY